MITLFTKALNTLRQGKTPDYFYGRLPVSQLIDPVADERAIRPNRDYFQIKLAQMRIAHQRAYWTSYSPVGVASTAFKYGGEDLTVPVIFNGRQDCQAAGTNTTDCLDLLNNTIIGPVPYLGGDVCCQMSLLRLTTDDLARRLLDTLGNISKSFNVPELNSYVSVIRKIDQGIDQLSGSANLKPVIGCRTVFNDSDRSSFPFQSGYILHANIDPAKLRPERLWIRESQLFWGDSAETALSSPDFDYYLVKIDRCTGRSDYTTLPFYRLWHETVNALLEGRENKARIFLIETNKAINNSADLTASHKSKLIKILTANFFKKLEESKSGSAWHPSTPASADRGVNATDSDEVKKYMGRIEARIRQPAVKKDFSSWWEKLDTMIIDPLPPPRSEDMPLSPEALEFNEQLGKKINSGAQDLADSPEELSHLEEAITMSLFSLSS